MLAIAFKNPCANALMHGREVTVNVQKTNAVAVGMVLFFERKV